MLRLEGVSVCFGQNHVLNQVDLSVAAGEVLVLLGPSGCGKSTLLRTIAGLETPSEGQLFWGAQDLTGLPAHQRGFGMMFQDHALFGHLSVADNVAFGLRIAGWGAELCQKKVAELMALVGLVGFEGRSVDALSGGEAQRVALARSLAPDPRLLMLDEPLASLDRALRDRLVSDLGQLLRELGQSAIYVTHDHGEAFALADRIAVMDGGQIARCGRPVEVWADPRTEAVARSIGHQNILSLDDQGHCVLGRLGGQAGLVLVRSDGLRLAPTGVAARVVGAVVSQGRYDLQVEAGGQLLQLSAVESVGLGDLVYLAWSDDAVVPLRSSST